MTNEKTKPDALRNHEENRNDVARLLDWLQLELEKHTEEMATDPRNWGRAGEMAHLRHQLIDVLDQFSGMGRDLTSAASKKTRSSEP